MSKYSVNVLGLSLGNCLRTTDKLFFFFKGSADPRDLPSSPTRPSPDLRQVIARAQEHPHGQHAGYEAVPRHQKRDGVLREGERRRPGAFGDPPADDEHHHASDGG